MRLVICIFIISIFSTSQFAVAADNDAEARKNLAGVWKGGVEGGAQGHVLTFTGDVATCVRDARGKTTDIGGGKVKLDLSKKPWRMDAAGNKGGQKGRSYFGIYSLDGNTLKWCVNSKTVPTNFKTGNGNFCLVLKRQKKDKSRQELLGVWKGGVEDGAQGHVLTITDDLVSCVRDASGKKTDIGGGTVKLNLSKKPWRMDAAGTKGGQRGRSYFGIYSLEGDTLKWCVNSKKAPTEFKTGNGNFCLVLKRQATGAKQTATTPTKTPKASEPGKYKVAVLKESAPEKLSAKIRKTLGRSGLRIAGPDGKVLCDVWFRVGVPVLPATSKQTGKYALESGTLVGAIRLSNKETGDFRNLKCPAGVYTMRYELQPKDDFHEASTKFRDFLLLLSASDDTDPARISDKEKLSQRSSAAGGGFHPAMLYLNPPQKRPQKLPAMVHTSGTDANTALAVLVAKTTAKGNRQIQFEVVAAGSAKE